MAAPGENLKINPDRLWDSLMEMAKIGPGVAGGNNRQTLTDADGVTSQNRPPGGGRAMPGVPPDGRVRIARGSNRRL